MEGRRVEIIKDLQHNKENIRNICILAHVDHGKTTLSDSLISSNQIISQKQAGKIRLLDSREDEQARQITMKSSSITLLHSIVESEKVKKKKSERVEEKKESVSKASEEEKTLESSESKENKEELKMETKSPHYLINLIDSPGHVEFSFEVSAALRLSDGALILIDALEGVSQQTTTVIRQAWEEGVKMALVINKIDKLFLEVYFDQDQAENQIKSILQQVNSIIASLFLSYVNKIKQERKRQFSAIEEEEFEKKEESLYFSPEKCNVAFASSLDCWGFSMRTFANIYSKKLGFNANKLVNLLWGKFYYNASTKKVTTKPINSSQKTMFSSFILKPLIDEYKKVSNSGFEKDSQKYRLILEKVKGKLSKWLPIAKTIFKVIIDHLPSPLEAQKARIKVLCPKLFKSKLTPDLQVLKRAVENCDNSELAPVVIYISKMMPINSMQIPDLRDQYLQQIRANPDSVASDSQSLIGFGRIFSGRIRKGGKYFVIGVKHGKDGFSDIHTVGIKHLYLFMGANLIPMQSIPAGNIVAIGDLQNILYKTGTISSNELCPSFLPLNLKSSAILKVAIESKKLTEMNKVIEGLNKLNKAELSAEVSMNASGEYILGTCGEVHLHKCIKDLIDDYARIQINVSEPIVNFKETITLKTMQRTRTKEKRKDSGLEKVEKVEKGEKQDIYLEKILNLKKESGLEKGMGVEQTPNKKCEIRVRAVGLDYSITQWLISQQPIIKKIVMTLNEPLTLPKKAIRFINEFNNLLVEHNTPKKLINLINGYLCSFAPKRTGPNLLINKYIDPKESIFGKVREKDERIRKQKDNLIDESKEDGKKITEETEEEQKHVQYHKQSYSEQFKNANLISIKDLRNSLISGFELATLHSPLCEEEMVGCCFIIENVDYCVREISDPQIQEQTSSLSPLQEHEEERKEEENKHKEKEKEEDKHMTAITDTYGPFTGQVKFIQFILQIICTMTDACRRAFLYAHPRLVEGLYLCSLQLTSDMLGKVYAVIDQRRGKMVSEQLHQETNYFELKVFIPVIESFGLAEKLAKKGEGVTYPQLVFSHWQIIEEDPFHINKTEEELEEFGEQILPPNIAKVLVDKVRKRKGLIIDEKIVTFAEKQRTLKRNK